MARLLYNPQAGFDVAQSFVANWLAVAGSVPAATRDATTACIWSLIQAGAWPKLDRLFLHATADAPHALCDLRYAALATAVNTPVFTANRGYQGNGTTQYIDLGFNWQTAGGKYQRDDASMGAWVETAPGAAQIAGHIGNENGAYGRITRNSTQREVSVNAGSGGPIFVPASQLGFVHGQRINATTLEGYGVAGTVEASATNNSANVGGRNMLALAIGHTTPSFYSDGRIAASWIGSSMTPSEVLAFRNALRTYMTAVGVA